jgi:DNA polymerase III epsilon subunit-like protein
MNILFFDLETTGQDSKKNTVIEIAARLDVDGVTVDTFEQKLFNPQSVTNLGALKYNGTKMKELMSRPNEGTAIIAFIDWLLSIQDKFKGDLYLCGQNIYFDKSFLHSLLDKYSVEGIDTLISHKLLDTFGLAIALQQVGKLQTKDNKLNLAAIAEALGIDTSNMILHTALADVNLTAQVLYKLLELIKK